MQIQRISAFSIDGAGGNPAGVVIGAALPPASEMARIAAEVGYSETAFAAPLNGAEPDGWRVRYFSPRSEVPFCGHATIALGAALGEAHGTGRYALKLNDATIAVEAERVSDGWRATLESAQTAQAPVAPGLLSRALEVFDLSHEDLDPALPPIRATAGAEQLVLPLKDRARLSRLTYVLADGAALLDAERLVGAYFIHRACARAFDARLAFPTGGVFEDPATGAAAAALSGWLRDEGRLEGAISIRQGFEMGAPSRLEAWAGPGRGAPVRVSGATRPIV